MWWYAGIVVSIWLSAAVKFTDFGRSMGTPLTYKLYYQPRLAPDERVKANVGAG